MLGSTTRDSIKKLIMDNYVDIHKPQGERFIQVAIESWMSYFGMTKIKADNSTIADIVTMIDTYASALGIEKKPGLEATRVDIEKLEKIIGQFVLVRGIRTSDAAAILNLKNILSSVINSSPVNLIQNLNIDEVLELGLSRVQDIIDGFDFESIEPPIAVERLARGCVFAVLSQNSNNNRIALPTAIADFIANEQAESQTLLNSFRQMSIIEDRIFNLLHADGYCNSIKQALISLKIRPLKNLSLSYFQNERLPNEDILEAMWDIDEGLTRDGNPLTVNNIDRNLNYLLNTMLVENLVREFQYSLQEVFQNPRSPDILAPILKYYFRRGKNGNNEVDSNNLLTFFSNAINPRNKVLFNDSVLELCRVIERQRQSRQQLKNENCNFGDSRFV
jgi:hypothetical protein